MTTQAMRAALLAMATATSLAGFLCNRPAAQGWTSGWSRAVSFVYRLDHAAEVLAGKDVDVEVEDLLVAVAADVGKEAVAVADDAELARHVADGAEEAADFGIACIGREIVHRNVGFLGDDQHVHRRLRVDVTESEGVRVLIDLVAGTLAAQDLGEYVVGIVIHGLAFLFLLRFGARRLFVEAGRVLAARQFGPHVGRRDADPGPQHQQVVEKVGALLGYVSGRGVVGGDRHLDRFLAHLLGDGANTPGEKLGGIGAFGISAAAAFDGREKALQLGAVGGFAGNVSLLPGGVRRQVVTHRQARRLHVGLGLADRIGAEMKDRGGEDGRGVAFPYPVD